ncbi:MAG TPA: substrate-binding domain-containing protein [Gammaproteobacteria bacterium]|jgi:ABC-type molybdate transport system substrate-binding protein
MNKSLLLTGLAALSLCTPLLAAPTEPVPAASTAYLPPWNPPPQGGEPFTVPEIDIVADLHGEVADPQLTVFFAGNQFMVVHDLVAAFSAAHPEYTRIFVETLPPGILEKQVEQGALVMGNLKVSDKPDVFTAGGKRLDGLQQTHHWFASSEVYCRNRLAIMVYQGNPKHVTGLSDLGHADLRVAMPNPKWEGVGRNIEDLYRKAGGQALDDTIMKTKVADGSTYLTVIHHRQTPLRILRRESDAAPVWYTEAYFQESILHNPVTMVTIPAERNMDVPYAAGLMKDAPHPEAAKAFMQFLLSAAGQAVYKKYGFEPPQP